MLMPICAGATRVSGGGSPPTLTSVSISPSVVQAGGTLTATPSSTGATSHTYQWTNGGANILGATSATFANDGTYGSTAINCTVVAHNASGSSSPVEAPADRVIRWIGYASIDGNSTTTAFTLDFGAPMPGQVNWLVVCGASPGGDITIEGVGPTAIASHADFKAAPSAVGNKQTYIYSNASTDQIINVQISATWGGRVVVGFRSVGYSATPGTAVSAGNSSVNQTPATATINVANNNGGVIAIASVYDGLDNPSGIAQFSGSTFQQVTVDDFFAAGVGYLATSNAALGVTAQKSAPTTSNKHMCAIPLVPV